MTRTVPVRVLVCEPLRGEAEAAAARLEGVEVGTFRGRCGAAAPLNTAAVRAAAAGSHGLAVVVLGGACLAGEREIAGTKLVDAETDCVRLVAPAALVDHLAGRGDIPLLPGWVTAPDAVDRILAARARLRNGGRRRLLLLDTGVSPEAAARLGVLAGGMRLDHTVLPVGTEHLRLRMERSVLTVHRKELEAEVVTLRREKADLAAVLDAIAVLGESVSEGEVVERLLALGGRLFAPGLLCLVTLERDGRPGRSFGRGCHLEERRLQAVVREALASRDPVQPTPEGFLVRLEAGGRALGVLVVERLAFPAHRHRYAEMARTLSGAFGLALAHGRELDRLRAEVSRIEAALRGRTGLEGLERICAGCKKVEEADGNWRDVEQVLYRRAGLLLRHGLCPDCLLRHFPGVNTGHGGEPG